MYLTHNDIAFFSFPVSSFHTCQSAHMCAHAYARMHTHTHTHTHIRRVPHNFLRKLEEKIKKSIFTIPLKGSLQPFPVQNKRTQKFCLLHLFMEL